MKSKFNTQQEIFFKRVSKLSFIPFGILVVVLSTSAFANEAAHETNFGAEPFTLLEKPPLPEDTDFTITLSSHYKKTIKEVIKEDNLIIDSNISEEVHPLDFNKIYAKRSERCKKERQDSFLQKKGFSVVL